MKHYEPAKPGTKLVGYDVMAEIGRGAASIIYIVQDPKSKQIYALKHVERADPKDDRFIKQAEIEYDIAQRVKHPVIRHIERVIKQRAMLITLKELYLLMEYVDGVSIERNPPRTFEDAVSVFKQVAMGLHHMHSKGYVHADMKPNNVVVNDKGIVKIIDLGQACAIGTIKERIQGTPDYIAPEQVHRREITPKTDIYNFGATMYWVLTRRNIPTALAKGDSLQQTIDDSLIEKPTPPRQLNPRIPEQLSDLIMHCVEIDPEKRPVDMFTVAERLDLIYAMLKAHGEAMMKSGGPSANQSPDDTTIMERAPAPPESAKS